MSALPTAARERVQRTWLACSLLLDYPTRDLLAALDDIAALVPDDPDLDALVRHLRSRDLQQLQEQYVETFDHTRSRALYLTYFAYGDTRRRGLALLRFKETYRRAGVVWDSTELPDHLCAVLQFGATTDLDAAWQLVTDHRAGVETLRLALARWRPRRGEPGPPGSPWAAALIALCRTLPVLRGEEADALRRLIEQGPPAEEVGLDGYGSVPLIAGSRIPVMAAAPNASTGARR